MTAHKIDVSKGETISTVSRQWAKRPEDQRFLSLSELRDQCFAWKDASRAVDVHPKLFNAAPADEGGLLIRLNDDDNTIITPTNYGFGDACAVAKAPAGYLRKLPAELAAACLNDGFKRYDIEDQKSAYLMDASEAHVLRCLTSTSYGRIFDVDVAEAVMKVAGDGVGDTHWKVPGTIDWGAKHGIAYNPEVDITKDNTTLYASDRDLFVFLVDDTHPIEVGKLANGDPDLIFRGFYVWNSEVGSQTFGVATMYLRGVCQNRNLWGVEGFTETTFRHTKGAPGKFVTHAAPSLESYAQGATDKLIAGVKAAKLVKIGGDNDERIDFYMKLGFSRSKAIELIATAIAEEGRPPESVWDAAQSITALARSAPHQDARLDMEKVAGKLLNKVAVPA